MRPIKGMILLIIPALSMFMPSHGAVAQQPGGKVATEEESAKQVVLANLEAFNRHDTAAMLPNLADPFSWYSVFADTMVVEEYTHDRFETEMNSYFAAYPEARSDLIDLQVFGRFVYFREKAIWGSDGEHEQLSLGIYEVKEDKITRVWYFQ